MCYGLLTAEIRIGATALGSASVAVFGALLEGSVWRRCLEAVLELTAQSLISGFRMMLFTLSQFDNFSRLACPSSCMGALRNRCCV